MLRYLPDRTFGLVETNVYFFRSHVLLNQRFFVAHQNILQLGRDVEAVLADYDRGGQHMHLVLVRYPDRRRQAHDGLQSFMKAYMPDSTESGSVKTEDGKWTGAVHYGEFLVIAFGAPTEAEAERLVDVTQTNLKGGAR